MPTSNVFSPDGEEDNARAEADIGDVDEIQAGGAYLGADAPLPPPPRPAGIRAQRAEYARMINNRAKQTKANDIEEQRARMEVDGISKREFTRKLIILGSKILNPYFYYEKCGQEDRGIFAYTIVKKYQSYRLDISNYSEAILSAALLTRRNLIDVAKLPAVYNKVYHILIIHLAT